MAIVAVKDFRREEKDPLDDMLNKISKGLQIAQSIYGIKTAMEQSDLRSLQQQAAEERLRSEQLKNKLAETGLLTPQQVIDSDIVTFKTKEDLAKAVGAQNWETAIQKYPALPGNIYEINVATPKRKVTTETGDVIGIDDESRLLKRGPEIIRPEDLKDFNVDTYKAAIKRGVLEQIQKSSVGGARSMKEFTEKWMPVDDPRLLQQLPSEIAALREPVQVMENGQVITRMGIRRSAVKPIQPTMPIDVARLQRAQIGIQEARLGLQETQMKLAERTDKIKKQNEAELRRKQGVYTPDEFYNKFIVIDDPDSFAKRTPGTAKYIPKNAIQKVKIQDVTGQVEEAYGVDKRIFDMAITQAKQETTAVGKKPKPSARAFGAKGFADRMREANRIFDDLEKSGFDRSELGTSLLSIITQPFGEVGEYFKPEELKQWQQAERNFVNAVLRPESGAAITESEFDNARKQYFPLAGDTAAVKAQKKRNREITLMALEREAQYGLTGEVEFIINEARDIIKGKIPPTIHKTLPPTKTIDRSKETDEEFLKRYLGR